MEKLEDSENKGKKRGPVDSDLRSPEEGKVDSDVSSPEPKRVRTDSDLNSPEFGRVGSAELGLKSGEANQIPNDILGILDEPDTVPDDDPGIQDLDSVIKSFEEEILYPSPPPALFREESGDTQPDLGYLLEASDDELGLPPTVSPSTEETETKSESLDLATVDPDAVGAERSLGLEDELPSYDSLGFGMGKETTEFNNSALGAVGDLFEDESGDFSEFLYRPESLQAL